MHIVFFLRGLIIGFSIAAPVGPIGVLCIGRTLTQGRISGLISGLGAATADALYGSIAAFGLTFISTMLINQQGWIRLIGGIFLCFLGIKISLSSPARQAARVKGHSLVSSYASTFFLTLTNPMTILSFAAIFAGLGVGSENSKLPIRRNIGPGRLHGFSFLVADFEQRGFFNRKKDRIQSTPMGQ